MTISSQEPSRDQLDGFIGSQNNSVYLQSWQWGDFQSSLARPISRRIWLKEDQIIAAATAVTHSLPMVVGYWYLPKGPVIAREHWHSEELWQEISNWIKSGVKKNNLLFASIEPSTDDASILPTIKSLGWQTAPTIQPPNTQLLDLSVSEAELLVSMHHKTRYNIRLAEKKGVKINWHGQEKLDEFFSLVQQTNRRDKITSFSRAYYQKMLDSLGDNAKIITADYQDQTIVANLIITFGDTVTYAHGASGDEYRNTMAPHLAQWTAIKWAKDNGFKYYDFRGIAPTDSSSHKWAGITRFKKGFGGRSVKQLGAFDLVNKSFWYKLYRLYRRG
ncbi:MAG: peptidoglycan bridge formation glycyltransferase FemA/FemB family protein [Patescibacteria group bacterium]